MQMKMARMAKTATPRPIPSPGLEDLEDLEALEDEVAAAFVGTG